MPFKVSGQALGVHQVVYGFLVASWPSVVVVSRAFLVSLVAPAAVFLVSLVLLEVFSK